MPTAISPTQHQPAGRYSGVSRALHWLVAGGIALQFILGERAEEAAANGDLPGQLAALAQHKSIGITVLGLALLRLLWRLVQPPTPALSTPTRQHQLARLMHIALYGLLFFMPVSGWLMSSASGYSVAWFNLAQLPDLIAPSESSKTLLQTLHNGASKLLLVLAIGHIVAALKHWLIDKDAVMSRMGGPLSTLLFVATLAIGIAYTWPTPQASPAAQLAVQPEPVGAAVSIAAEAPESVEAPEPTELPGTDHTTLPLLSLPPLWRINPADSHIRFTAQQAGADFTGEWQKFSAVIRFNANDLANSSAEVTIDATSVATNDSERDGILAGFDWFDSGNHPQVVFSTDTFRPTIEGFTTAATLKLRDASYPINFNFSVQSDANARTLTGNARLDRLALKLGVMEWLDTEWVGQFVDVQVHVEAEIQTQ